VFLNRYFRQIDLGFDCRKGIPIITIAVLARNTLLRTGIIQILADVAADVTLQEFSYPDLERPPCPMYTCDLLLLSIASPERLESLVYASIKTFAPKRIILMAEGSPLRAAIEKLPALVAGYIDKSAPAWVWSRCS